MAVKLMIFGARALQGTLLHTRLDDLRAAGIQFAVIGTERDSREIENTGLILSTALVGTASEEQALTEMNNLIKGFTSRVQAKPSEVMVVGDSELYHLAARSQHVSWSSARGLDILLSRAKSVEEALEFIS